MVFDGGNILDEFSKLKVVILVVVRVNAPTEVGPKKIPVHERLIESNDNNIIMIFFFLFMVVTMILKVVKTIKCRINRPLSAVANIYEI